MQMSRGEVHHPEFFRRHVLFTGLKYGNITPTDFDLVLEFKDKAWVVGEFKHKNANGVPLGQRIALERAVDDWQNNGKTSVAIIAEHDSDAEPIAADCKIIEFRWLGKWMKPTKDMTVKEFIDRFYKKHIGI